MLIRYLVVGTPKVPLFLFFCDGHHWLGHHKNPKNWANGTCLKHVFCSVLVSLLLFWSQDQNWRQRIWDKAKCYWEHIGNPVRTWWEHIGIPVRTWWEHIGNPVRTWWEHIGNPVRTWWEHIGNPVRTWWEHFGKVVPPLLLKRKIKTGPLSACWLTSLLPRISMPTFSVLYHFWRRLMGGAWTLGCTRL